MRTRRSYVKYARGGTGRCLKDDDVNEADERTVVEKLAVALKNLRVWKDGWGGCDRVHFYSPNACDEYEDLRDAICLYEKLTRGMRVPGGEVAGIYAAIHPETDYESESPVAFKQRVDKFGEKILALEKIVSSYKYQDQGKKRPAWACGSLGYVGRDGRVFRCRSRGRYMGQELCRPPRTSFGEVECGGHGDRKRRDRAGTGRIQ